VPRGPRHPSEHDTRHFGTITEIFQTQLRRTALMCRLSSSSRNMSYHKNLLSVLIFILLYCDYIIFWLADCVSPPALEIGLGHGSGSQLPGEYGYVFVLKSSFTGHMCLSDSNYVAVYSPISCIDHVHPILGVACAGTHCKVTNRVSRVIFSLMVLNILNFCFVAGSCGFVVGYILACNGSY
jgi:hypothetical protein